MKTPIIFLRYGQHPTGRGVLRKLDKVDKEVGATVVSYSGSYEYSYHKGFDFSKTYSRVEPESVLAGTFRYYFKRDRADEVRVIPEPYVGRIHELDEQLHELMAERRRLIEEAFRHGRPITKAELVAAKEEA